MRRPRNREETSHTVVSTRPGGRTVFPMACPVLGDAGVYTEVHWEEDDDEPGRADGGPLL